MDKLAAVQEQAKAKRTMATCTWLTYQFEILPMHGPWNDVGGIYIFSGLAPNGRWSAYYIGKCDSFKNRCPNHERWDEAVRLGATHVHALAVPQEPIRAAIEQELIQWAQPALNTHHR